MSNNLKAVITIDRYEDHFDKARNRKTINIPIYRRKTVVLDKNEVKIAKANAEQMTVKL